MYKTRKDIEFRDIVIYDMNDIQHKEIRILNQEKRNFITVYDQNGVDEANTWKRVDPTAEILSLFCN